MLIGTPGEKNPAELGPDSLWQQGPDFLANPMEKWPIKSVSEIRKQSNQSEDNAIIDVHTATITSTKTEGVVCFTRVSGFQILQRAIGLVLMCLRNKSFRQKEELSIEILQEARLLILKEAQTKLENPQKNFKRQGVIKTKEGLWAVGARNSHGDLQILVPRNNRISTLLMDKAHRDARHTGRDSTLAMFRSEYYVTQGSKLAKKVRERCTKCRIIDKKTLTQLMGKVPVVSLKPAQVFNCTQLDLFGPWPSRGEVQKRTTGKCWGCLFVCMASRAVHIEIISGYSTDDFLMGLSRFGHLRGWPSDIRSDPGSQLVGAEK